MMKQGNCIGCKIAGLLAAIGALNWGLVGIFQFDLVERLLGSTTTPARIVYGVIGVAGLMKLDSCFMCCPCCKKDSAECKK